MESAVVLAAIDLGPSTERVLYHAVGFARLLDAKLKILNVAADRSKAAHDRLLQCCLRLGPYQEDFDQDQIVIRTGRVSDAIARQARADGAVMIVTGSRSHGVVTRFLLGSTSEAVLRNATTPVLLVPPTGMDIVSVADRIVLRCGPVVAAVDLADDSRDQLRMASRIAQLGRQPLMLMTGPVVVTVPEAILSSVSNFAKPSAWMLAAPLCGSILDTPVPDSVPKFKRFSPANVTV